MKAFFVALLALPATLAAPLADGFPMQSLECTCMNAAGETRASGACQYLSGFLHSPGEWCYRHTAWAPAMDTIFTNEGCVDLWGSEWNKGVCRPVKLCQAPGGSDYYQIC
ncbi:hypothetical protein DM02DRAFT_632119 [Periconia macrospinosa]|uniref:Uncharacterized protein n=1 Tax=Periconia macrospinosa TaxID=97972 RepID=A0A2V1DE34_9PLEO|nr:hypothetical protein DM02DRAFT_632119 [Periconia macrospinosa]